MFVFVCEDEVDCACYLKRSTVIASFSTPHFYRRSEITWFLFNHLYYHYLRHISVVCGHHQVLLCNYVSWQLSEELKLKLKLTTHSLKLVQSVVKRKIKMLVNSCFLFIVQIFSNVLFCFVVALCLSLVSCC